VTPAAKGTTSSEKVSAPEPPDTGAGANVVRASWCGTGAFVLTAVAAAVRPASLDIPALIVSVVLFTVGLFVFAWAFLVAVGRSREEEIAVAGLFLLSGSAPTRVKRILLGSLAVEVVAALVTAGVRPYTSLAFGALVPLYGLAMAGLWAARYGTFPPRVVRHRRRPAG
jgi:hypothetical protein